MVLQASSVALANGDAVEIARSRQGQYELVVGIQPETPRVGTIHFSFVPLDASTSLPVTNAVIVVVASTKSGRLAYESRAVNAPSAPQYYDANLTFEEAGEWTLSVSVRSPQLGQAKFEIPFVIQEDMSGPGTEGALVLLAVVFILAGGATYVWHSARRRRAVGL